MQLSVGWSTRVFPSRKLCAGLDTAESWSAVSFVVSVPTSSGAAKPLSNRICLGFKRNGMLDCVMAPNCGGGFGWLALVVVSALSPNGQRDDDGQKRLKADSAMLLPRAPSLA